MYFKTLCRGLRPDYIEQFKFCFEKKFLQMPKILEFPGNNARPQQRDLRSLRSRHPHSALAVESISHLMPPRPNIRTN